MKKTFTDKLVDVIKAKQSILCVGLDPQLKFMPPHLIEWVENYHFHTSIWEGIGRLFFDFNKQIIDAVTRFAVAVKPQMAFYGRYGHWGIWAYEQTIEYARSRGLRGR